MGESLNPVETGLFFSVGREPPDEGEAEAALIASAKDNLFSEEALATRGRSFYPPLLPLKTLPNLILGHLSIHFDLCGENAAWAGEGVQSFVESVWAILEGRAERILVGAADSHRFRASTRYQTPRRFGTTGEAGIAFGYWNRSLWRRGMLLLGLKWILLIMMVVKARCLVHLSLHCGLKSAIVEWWNHSQSCYNNY